MLKINRIHWTDLPGNKYLKKLEPDMLKNRCVAVQTIRQIGVNRNELRKEVEVFYDRDYVLIKLLIDVIAPLHIDSLERLVALVTDAWNEIEVIKSVGYDEREAG